MIDRKRIPEEILALLDEKLAGRSDEIDFPPPVFDAMQGEVIAYDLENNSLSTRFPVLKEQLNPYGSMQGGIIAAAIDNTIGPLSLLISPPNFTRQMEVKYSKVVSFELGYIYITARFIKKNKRQLFFEAVVENKDKEKLASAKSRHWIID